MFKRKLREIYLENKNNVIVENSISFYRRIVRRGKKVRVVFLCQMPQLWNKMQSVYDYMIKDDKFEVVVLAIPDTSVGEEKQAESLEFFLRLNGKVIKAKTEDGWISLKNISPNYVFYQRPYDHYLPDLYQSGQVAAFARICYIPYAYVCATPVEVSCYNKDFFENLYLFFAENQYARDLIYNRDKKAYDEKRKKIFYLGFPALRYVIDHKNSHGLNVVEDNTYKILWCPRWTTDIMLGRSNFFEYKDKIVDFLHKNKTYSMVFRPHPMLFSNFEKTGEMSEKEAKIYLARIRGEDNIYYDESPDYYNTLWNTDVLVADLTTLIIEYLVTQKPVICFATNIEYNDFMKPLLEVCYCVDSWESLIEIVSKLSEGKDPLKEKRCKIVDELLNVNQDVAENIAKEICNDFYYLKQ